MPAQRFLNFMTTFTGFTNFACFSGFSEGLGILLGLGIGKLNSEPFGKTRKTNKICKTSKSGNKIKESLCRHRDPPCPTYKINVFPVKTYGLD